MNIFFEEEFWKYAFIVTAALSLIGIGVLIYKYDDKSQLCKEKGGVMVELTTGYACVKLERIELK